MGAKINGKIVPLDYKLKNGDIVDILTSPSSNGPSRDWLNIIKSSQARNKIRQWFKKEKREENIQKGKEILEKEVRRQGYQFSKLFKTEWIEKVLKKFNYNSIDDIYATVGYGGLSINQVLSPLKEEYNKLYEKAENKDDLGLNNIKKLKGKNGYFKWSQGLGFKDMAVHFANAVILFLRWVLDMAGRVSFIEDCTNIGNLEGSENC